MGDEHTALMEDEDIISKAGWGVSKVRRAGVGSRVAGLKITKAMKDGCKERGIGVDRRG
jgi:hypothetical protein